MQRVPGIVLTVLAAATALAAAAAPPGPVTSSWPSSRPVRLVVPHPAGTEADAIAIPLAASLSDQLGTPVELDHRPGLGGDLGAEIVARSAADGYTFLLGSAEHAVAAASLPAPGYDLQRDLAPVTLIAIAPAVIVVGSTSPVASVTELLRRGAAPAPITSAQVAAPPQLPRYLGDAAAGNRVALLARRQMLRLVPHPDVFAIVPVPVALAAIRDGTLRALAVTGRARSFVLPAVPTLTQAGAADVQAQTWYALWSPAGTPTEINVAMQRHVATALDRKPIVDTWNRLGYERGGQAEPVLTLTVRSAVLNWKQVIGTLDVAPRHSDRAPGPTGSGK